MLPPIRRDFYDTNDNYEQDDQNDQKRFKNVQKHDNDTDLES